MNLIFRVVPISSANAHLRYVNWISLIFNARSYRDSARSRFYNYYGERHARLERTASVFSDAENRLARTWFIKISSPLLFFIPDSNLKSFQKAYVDAIVHKYDWENIMTTLNHEWKQMVLLVRHFSCSASELSMLTTPL